MIPHTGEWTSQANGRFRGLTHSFRRIRELGALNLLLGLYLRRSFTRAGILIVHPGFPLPRVTNRGGHVEAGNCSFFPGVHIECWKGATGAGCMIARDVLIMDTDQHPVGGRALVSKPVEIGDRVWLGSRAIVLKGVTIGHDSIVGAGAIVTKSVPPHSVVVGPAATVIRTLQEQSR